MLCKNCSEQILDGEAFCINCGNKIEIGNSDDVSPVERKSDSLDVDPQTTESELSELSQQNETSETSSQTQATSEQTNQNITNNKKAVKKSIIIISSIVLFVTVIILLFSLFPSVDLKSNTFVKNWNRLAKESSDNITAGVIISNKKSSHTYDLGNGATLEYSVVKHTLAINGELTTLVYKKSDFMNSNMKDIVEKLIVFTGFKCDEKVESENFVKSLEKLIPDAVKGVRIGYDYAKSSLIVTEVYRYSTNFGESKITGLNFGITFEEFLNKYNALFADNNKPNYKLYATDSEYINCAKNVIDDYLKAPSTASSAYEKVLEKDSYGRAIVLVEVDAENSFGALIRTKCCVVIQGINYDDTFDYNTLNSVQTYTDFTQNLVVANMKNLNNFGKPQVDEKVKKKHQILRKQLKMDIRFIISRDNTRYMLISKQIRCVVHRLWFQ